MWCLPCGRSAYLEDETLIVLIGPSGSGKTSFIRQLAGDLSDPATYRFNKPTTRITATTVDIQGVDITLLDTPGIGSLASGRELSGYDIFRLVRNWLQNKRHSAHLTGILYFQNVDNKQPVRPDIDYFSGICEANNFYSSLVLVATKLGRIHGGGWAKLREYEGNLWKGMICRGAKALLYKNTKESAEEVIAPIIHQRTRSW
ncbi:hypothetical protein EDD16DRAFT_602999 [Pisolithus croceorrhizus]|nr:hypothetical protein EDD16DRAFT_602999 [Pisolithus croceorrhizus]